LAITFCEHPGSLLNNFLGTLLVLLLLADIFFERRIDVLKRRPGKEIGESKRKDESFRIDSIRLTKISV
jgi:hypothetical protein